MARRGKDGGLHQIETEQKNFFFQRIYKLFTSGRSLIKIAIIIIIMILLDFTCTSGNSSIIISRNVCLVRDLAKQRIYSIRYEGFI